MANLTGWHKMTFVGILSVSSHFVLSEFLMRGVRKKLPRLILPWTLASFVEEVTLVALGLKHLGSALDDRSFVEGFADVGGFFIVSMTITGEEGGRA